MRDVVSRALPTNLQSQLEELVKVNESQRHMLQELSGMIHAAAAASKTTPATRQHSSSLSISESFSERYYNIYNTDTHHNAHNGRFYI